MKGLRNKTNNRFIKNLSDRNCLICKVPFQPRFDKIRLCSFVCRNKWLAQNNIAKRNIKNCEQCAKEFKYKPIEKDRKFCSMKCYGDNQKGKKISDETKIKLSEANKGEKSYRWKGGLPKCEKCGKKLSGYNYKFCKEHRKKMNGKNSCRWKGGITPINRIVRSSLEFKLWRKAVFERDDYKCQKCVNGGYLHPHHIKNFAKVIELRFAIDNGITFCKKCHQEFHKIYGRQNNNQEQLNEFLQQ